MHASMRIALVSFLFLPSPGWARRRPACRPSSNGSIGPRSILYVFCVDADAKENDFLP